MHHLYKPFPNDHIRASYLMFMPDWLLIRKQRARREKEEERKKMIYKDKESMYFLAWLPLPFTIKSQNIFPMFFLISFFLEFFILVEQVFYAHTAVSYIGFSVLTFCFLDCYSIILSNIKSGLSSRCTLDPTSIKPFQVVFPNDLYIWSSIHFSSIIMH